MSSASEKKKEDWMNSKWRPMMGWMYMSVCAFDFMVAPILWSMTQAIFHGGIATQWQPLTLQGAGLFHVAMGAVLGITAYGRTQEKLGGANNGGASGPGGFTPGSGTTYVPPGGQVSMGNQPGMGGGFNSVPAFGAPSSGFGGNTNGGFNSPSSGAPAFGAPSTGFGASPSGFGSTVPAASGFGGGGFGSTPAAATTTPAIGKFGKVIPMDDQPAL